MSTEFPFAINDSGEIVPAVEDRLTVIAVSPVFSKNTLPDTEFSVTPDIVTAIDIAPDVLVVVVVVGVVVVTTQAMVVAKALATILDPVPSGPL